MKARQRMVDTLPWHDDALLAGSDDEEYAPLTDEQRDSIADDEYWLRIDAEASGRVREWHR